MGMFLGKHHTSQCSFQITVLELPAVHLGSNPKATWGQTENPKVQVLKKRCSPFSRAVLKPCIKLKSRTFFFGKSNRFLTSLSTGAAELLHQLPPGALRKVQTHREPQHEQPAAVPVAEQLARPVCGLKQRANE